MPSPFFKGKIVSTVYKILLCDVLNPITDKKAMLTRQAAIVLKPSKSGFKIHKIGPSNKIVASFPGASIIDRSGHLALPGFFDMHFHWVQDDVRLMPKDSLLEWLSKYTWPYEMKFKSKKYSKEKAKKFSQELLSVGTLGGAIYASIHGHTVDDALENFKGDFIAGNVLMTMNSPKGLSQTREQALNLVESLSAKWGKAYAMTPRFAPTTHPDVMKAGAWLAKKRGSFIQTHLSETKAEIEYVLDLYKKHDGYENIPSYTDIYKKCGMLGKKTIMGHGIHLSKDELATLSKTGTVIAHCPTSNAPVKEKGLGSGLFDFKKIEKAGVRWALGSDIGGGPFLSMFDVMQSFVEQNKKAKVSGATFTKALYRATKSGAEVLGLHKKMGSLDEGMLANLILVESPKGKNAEEALVNLHKPFQKKREGYLDLVIETYYAGEALYSKI